jgi:hypothetical protein
MRRLVLAAGDGDPVIQVLDLDSGEATPVPSPLDGGGAFDNALPRAGWVAVQAGYRVAAYRDGSLLAPTVLGDAWQMCPARSAAGVLLAIYQGRSRGEDEPLPLAVVGPDGAVARSASLPVWQPVGETTRGIVTAEGVWTWAGEQVESFSDAAAIGVLAGNSLVLDRSGRVEVVDDAGTVLVACPTPPEARFGLDVQYDANASRLAATAWGERGVLIADLAEGPRWLPLDFEPYHPVWLDAQGLLLFELAEPDTAVIVDVRSGSTQSLRLRRRAPVPRVDVTGRFDPEEVRVVLLPAQWSPPSPEERDAALEQQRADLELNAPPDLKDLLALAAPSARLRACLPPRRPPLGGSRLGGRPDVPRGFRWPKDDVGPMAFLAQIRLSDVAPVCPDGSLPSSGLLLVFIGLEADGGYPRTDRSIHAVLVDTPELKRAMWPARLPEELRFETAVLVPEPLLSLPSDPPGLSGNAWTQWCEFLEATQPRPPHHRMLGHAVTIQDQPPPVGSENEPSVLLLQIDSDGIAGMSFGDGGSLLVWVPAEDLRVGDFSRCTVDLDSH